MPSLNTWINLAYLIIAIGLGWWALRTVRNISMRKADDAMAEAMKLESEANLQHSEAWKIAEESIPSSEAHNKRVNELAKRLMAKTQGGNTR